MEYYFGNLFIRPTGKLPYVLGHKHNFDHGTFAVKGWMLVQMLDDNYNVVKQTQIITKDYAHNLALMTKYEPHLLRVPHLVPSTNKKSPWGAVVCLGHNEIVEGAKPIPYKPVGNRVLIKAGVMHAIWALSFEAEWDCIYSHQNAQGEVTQTPTGWEDAYR